MVSKKLAIGILFLVPKCYLPVVLQFYKYVKYLINCPIILANVSGIPFRFTYICVKTPNEFSSFTL